MSSKKKMILNLICSMSSFITNLLINFLLSPYIVKTIGIEANGFISLGNNFITYISLITTAISSMSARFVTVSLYEKKEEDAKRYYSSSTMSNILVVVLLIVPSVILVRYLDSFISIPNNLIFDVKLLFALLITNFLLNTLGSSFTISYFCKDSLYIQNIVTLIGYLIRLVSIVLLFIFFKPNVFYIAIAALIVIIFTILTNYIIKIRIMNDIKFEIKNVKILYMWTLLKSGFWNSINTLGTILLTGLDLLIANIFLGPTAMGLLSLVKTITNVISTLNNQLSQVFYPRNTILFAEKKNIELVKELKKEMNIMSLVNAIPVACLIVFGKQFFSLWQPTQNSRELYILCIFSIYSLVLSGGMDVLWSIFTVSNKLKWNSILVIISGIINTTIVIILIKYTNIGIYAIAGISPFISLLRNILYTIPYSAKYIGAKKSTFYLQLIKSAGNIIIFCLVGFIISKIIVNVSWLFLTLKVIIMVSIGLLLNYLFTFNKEEKNNINNLIKEMVK